MSSLAPSRAAEKASAPEEARAAPEAGPTRGPRAPGVGIERVAAALRRPSAVRELARPMGNSWLQRALADRSAGAELEPGIRVEMEWGFGRAFGDVRVHTDARADELTRGLRADAFTRGRDVYFAAGSYRPATSEGRSLLAHELAHAVQNEAGAAARSLDTPGDAAEREAASAAAAFSAGAPPPTLAAAPALVARQETKEDEEARAAAGRILERLSGYTSDEDSKEILAAFKRPPEAVRAIVRELRAQASRYDETPEGVLAWLLGDVTPAHRQALRVILAQAQPPAVDEPAVLSAVETIMRVLVVGPGGKTGSAQILLAFQEKSPETVRGILRELKVRGGERGMGPEETVDRLFDNVIEEDRGELRHLLSQIVPEGDLARIAAREVKDLLEGFTSEEDSREIKTTLARFTPDGLELVLVELEAQMGMRDVALAYRLFDDLDRAVADELREHFFGSGAKASFYASSYTAAKVEILLAGFTSYADAGTIVDNFKAAPDEDRRIVLAELDRRTRERWQRSAEDALMENLSEDAYGQLRGLPGVTLRPYVAREGVAAVGDWALGVVDFVATIIEVIVGAVVGIVTGIAAFLLGLIGIVWDILKAAYYLVMSLVYLVSWGRAGSEEWLAVKEFFAGLGQLFAHPGDIIAQAWAQTVRESATIEGKYGFEYGRRVEFWTRRAVTFVLNVYFFVRGAAAGAKATAGFVSQARKVGLRAAFVKTGEQALAAGSRIAGQAGSVAKTLLASLRPSLATLQTIGRRIKVLLTAAGREDVWRFLRRQLGAFREGEAEFWRSQRQYWTERAQAMRARHRQTTGKGEDADARLQSDQPASGDQQTVDEVADETNKLDRDVAEQEEQVLGKKQPEERPPVQPPRAALPAAGEILARGPTRESVFEAYLAAADRAAPDEIEVGIFRRQLDSGDYEYAVVQGFKGGVNPPSNQWTGVSHVHHGAVDEPGYRNPAPQDFTAATKDLGRRPEGAPPTQVEHIHSRAPDGSVHEVEYGIDLHNHPDRPYFVRPPGHAQPLRFKNTYPDWLNAAVNEAQWIPNETEKMRRLIELFKQLDPNEFYAGWYARQFQLGQPGASAVIIGGQAATELLPEVERERAGAGESLQRAVRDGAASEPDRHAVEQALADRSAGAELDATTRDGMETRFGRRFGDVRVHADARADELARGLDAVAFTRGRDVYFAAGKYRPATGEGRDLLAHELAHTVQQEAAQPLGSRGDAAEREARAAAAAVSAGAPPPRLGAARAAIARQEPEPVPHPTPTPTPTETPPTEEVTPARAAAERILDRLSGYTSDADSAAILGEFGGRPAEAVRELVRELRAQAPRYGETPEGMIAWLLADVTPAHRQDLRVILALAQPAPATVTTAEGAKPAEDPAVAAVDMIMEALVGVTGKPGSARILLTFQEQSPEAVRAILRELKRRGEQRGMSADETVDWLFDNLIAEDRNELRNLLSRIVPEGDLARIAAREVKERLEGFTSESDSQEIKSTLSQFTPPGLELVLVQLEAQMGLSDVELAYRLFDDLDRVVAEELRQYFFASGPKAVLYASTYTAAKIEALLAGFTSYADAHTIIDNFRSTPDLYQSLVLADLDRRTRERWQRSAEDTLMENVSESAYRELDALPGLTLRPYVAREGLAAAGDWALGAADFIVSIVEILVGAAIGVVTGIAAFLLGLIGIVWDILKAAYYLVMSFVYLVTWGAAGSEEWLAVKDFFAGLAQLLAHPGDVIAAAWAQTLRESATIEGKYGFEYGRRAEFWTRRVVTFLLNLYFFIKGAAATAKAGAGFVAQARKVGLRAAFVKTGEQALAAGSKLAGAAGEAASALLKSLRPSLETLTRIGRRINVILAATSREDVWRFLRTRAKVAVQEEAAFWRSQRDYWAERARMTQARHDQITARAQDAEGRLQSEQPATTDQQVVDDVADETNKLDRDVADQEEQVLGKKQPEEAAPVKPPPPRPLPSPGEILATGPTRESVFEAYLAAADRAAPEGIEVGIYRRRLDSGEEFAVVQGTKGAVSPPKGDGWSGVSHVHPGAVDEPGFRNPAPQDFTAAIKDWARRAPDERGPVVQHIHSRSPDGTLHEVEFGIDDVADPRRPYFVRPPGQTQPVRFVDTYPDEIAGAVNAASGIRDETEKLRALLQIFRRLDENEYYAGWWARRFQLGQPGASAVTVGGAAAAELVPDVERKRAEAGEPATAP